MGRSGGGCALCQPGKRHNRQSKVAHDAPVENCNRCRAFCCVRHIRWRDDEWLCTRCDRKVGQRGR